MVVLNDQSCDVIPLRQYDWTLYSICEIVRMPQSGVRPQNAIKRCQCTSSRDFLVPSQWLYLCWVHFRLNLLNDKFLSVLKLQCSPFSLCSAGFLHFSVNRRTHAVTRTKDNPISSSPFVLTRYHLEYLEGSNRYTSSTLAVSSPSSIIW